MKRMILWLLGAAMAMSANAQHWNFGIEAGYLNSRMAVEELSAEPNHGFMAGIRIELSAQRWNAFGRHVGEWLEIAGY